MSIAALAGHLFNSSRGTGKDCGGRIMLRRTCSSLEMKHSILLWGRESVRRHWRRDLGHRFHHWAV